MYAYFCIKRNKWLIALKSGSTPNKKRPFRTRKPPPRYGGPRRTGAAPAAYMPRPVGATQGRGSATGPGGRHPTGRGATTTQPANGFPWVATGRGPATTSQRTAANRWQWEGDSLPSGRRTAAHGWQREEDPPPPSRRTAAHWRQMEEGPPPPSRRHAAN